MEGKIVIGNEKLVRNALLKTTSSVNVDLYF